MILSDIKGYEGVYKVSDNGDVYSLNKRGFSGLYKLKKEVDICGYHRVSLCKNGKHTHKRVNRLVAEAFIPNPENKPIVNHIDYNKENNSVTNLEWVTQRENVTHSAKVGRYSNNRAKEIFSLDNEMRVKRHRSLTDASKETGVDIGNIVRACNSKSRKCGNYLWFRTEREAILWKTK